MTDPADRSASPDELLDQAFAELEQVLATTRATVGAALAAAACAVVERLRTGGKVLVCGNGGSAADAQHFAAEVVGRFARERVALPAIALTPDSAVLTALANDRGYDQVFARQIEGLARPGDVVIVISTSGNSPSALEAARRARERGCVVVGLTGAGGGGLAPLVDHLVAIPSATVARVQEMHELCLHCVAELIEAELAGGTDER